MIIGHKKIIDFLNKSIASDSLAHAYLFVGPGQVGKRLIALEFAKGLQCEMRTSINNGRALACGQCASCREIDGLMHPDVLIVEPGVGEDKKRSKKFEIGIGQIRHVRQQLTLLSYRGSRKIVIIDQAEKMTRDAANALLKTLEEPAKKTHLILVSSAQQLILSTIASRCLLVKFSLASYQEMHSYLNAHKGLEIIDREKEKVLSLAAGRPRLLKYYLEEPRALDSAKNILQELRELLKKDISSKFAYAESISKDNDLTERILSLWLFFFRNLFLVKLGCQISLAGNFLEADELKDVSAVQISGILKKILETKRNLSNPSFNARLALENLMLNF